MQVLKLWFVGWQPMSRMHQETVVAFLNSLKSALQVQQRGGCYMRRAKHNIPSSSTKATGKATLVARKLLARKLP